jgi:hypothetical protein
VVTGTGQTPPGFQHGYASHINGTDIAIVHVPFNSAGSDANCVWIYKRTENAWLFLGGSATNVNAAASNGGTMPIGSHLAPIHAIPTSGNNITILIQQGYSGFISGNYVRC